MSHEPCANPDPQAVLPPHFRGKWVVIPRDGGLQIFLVGALFGAGLALTVVGFLYDSAGPLRWGFPLALVAMFLQNHLIPWSEKRLLRELTQRSGVAPRSRSK